MFYASTTPGMDKVLSIAGAILKTVNGGTTELTARELARRSGAIREMQSDLGKIRLALTPFVVNGWLTPAEPDAEQQQLDDPSRSRRTLCPRTQKTG